MLLLINLTEGRIFDEYSLTWCLPTPTEPSPIKIFIVTDNASNMKAAFNGTNYIHRFYFAHPQQLTVSGAKTSTPNIACKIIGHYNRLCRVTARLDKVQENMQLPKLKLIQDGETRWCSKFVMLGRLLILREHIGADLSSSNLDIDCLSSPEWRLADGTVYVFNNTYPTASVVIPIIHCLKEETENYVKKYINEHGRGIPFARNLFKALTSRFPLLKMDDKLGIYYC
ncbi:hypothetical protein PR048_018026 [Dryococelus australis]|uniref:Uncharacterized protein n=1 Tax=Dryococelus australis TaxID=614101 RepID=A0ABQ9HB95_9NEOP|nr:hypothetical protein PR048_018026 [Dryococelus australis]